MHPETQRSLCLIPSDTKFTPKQYGFLLSLSLEADKQRWICYFTLQYDAAPLGLIEDHNSSKLNNYLLSNYSNKQEEPSLGGLSL